jgi:hypothetical protein
MSTVKPSAQSDLARPRLKSDATNKEHHVATRSKKTKPTTEPAGDAVQSDPVGETMQTIGEAIADATSAGLMPEAGTEPKDPSTTVAEDPEFGSHGHAELFLMGNLIKLFKSHFCRLAEPWGKLREEEQARVLRNLHQDLKDQVRQTVKIIAGNGRVSFRAEVESVQFKGATDIKAALKLVSGPEAHALADAAGGVVTVLIESLDELLAIPEGALAGDPDEPSLFDKSTEGTVLDTEREDDPVEA